MSAFQGIIYGIVYAVSMFLPLGDRAHIVLLASLTEWPSPNGSVALAMNAGLLLGVFIYFRHELLSMLACQIEMLFYWKAPMTLDGRLPYFLFLTGIIPLGFWFFTLNQDWLDLVHSPIGLVSTFAIGSVILKWSNNRNIQTKSFLRWNWKDSIFVGIFLCLGFAQGIGFLLAGLSAAFLLNYEKESAAKYAFLMLVPILIFRICVYYPAAEMEKLEGGIPWLVTILTGIVSLLFSLITINGFFSSLHERNFSRTMWYRWSLTVLVILLAWVLPGDFRLSDIATFLPIGRPSP
jgi:undecaprenyl-diphosphatase